MNAVSIFSPAKINLFLAITGRRSDGFHDLVSVAAPLEFGDTVRIEPTVAEGFSLECDSPDMPLDGTNLVLRAAALFRETTGWPGGARFVVEKKIPVGAGLGGGSSNATATLVGLNRIAGGRLGRRELAALAAQLGSDCALFLENAPVAMRGRGERVERLGAAAAKRLRGRRVLVFKPDFGIGTAWAYSRMAANAPGSYLAADAAEARLAAWSGDDTAPAEELLFNNMEAVAFGKFLALPTLLAWLRDKFGVVGRMSGSGSACYAFLRDDAPVAAMQACIREAWGEDAFAVETKIG